MPRDRMSDRTMFHLDEQIMGRCVAGSATEREVERIRRHAIACRACARWLEEWRDAYPDMDRRFPSLILEDDTISTVTPDGLVVVPGSEGRRSLEVDPATVLWIGAVFMALLVGYAASRPASRSDGGAPVAEMVPGYPTATPALPDSGREADPVRPLPPAGAPGTDADAAPADQAETSPALEASPGFRLASRAQATRRLGGRPRTVGGLSVERYEIGPPSAVSGALPDAGLVRIVYRLPDGRPVFLDQQLIPADSSGFRPIDDPALENGEVSTVRSPEGVSRARWLDSAGFLLSLTARVPLDSLQRFVARVR